jgi:hypothetical protein
LDGRRDKKAAHHGGNLPVDIAAGRDSGKDYSAAFPT